MPSECLVIALIFMVLVFGFFRAKRKNWALWGLPLGFIPTVAGAVMYAVIDIMGKPYDIMLPVGLVLGSLAITCIWIGACSVILIKTKRMRVPYVVSTVGFSFALSLIIIIKYKVELGL